MQTRMLAPRPRRLGRKPSHREQQDVKMKKMCVDLANSTNRQLKEQEARHAKEITDLRLVNRDTQNLLTTKTIPSQTITMNDHCIAAHFNAMTKRHTRELANIRTSPFDRS
jgi:hypothetical protein